MSDEMSWPIASMRRVGDMVFVELEGGAPPFSVPIEDLAATGIPQALANAQSRDLSAVVDGVLGDDTSAVHTVTKVKQRKDGKWKVWIDAETKFVVLQADTEPPRVGDQVALIVQIRRVESFGFRTEDGQVFSVGRPRVYVCPEPPDEWKPIGFTDHQETK